MVNALGAWLGAVLRRVCSGVGTSVALPWRLQGVTVRRQLKRESTERSYFRRAHLAIDRLYELL